MFWCCEQAVGWVLDIYCCWGVFGGFFGVLVCLAGHFVSCGAGLGFFGLLRFCITLLWVVWVLVGGVACVHVVWSVY